MRPSYQSSPQLSNWEATWWAPGTGNYSIRASAVDDEGIVDPTPVWRRFTVVDNGSPTGQPDVVVIMTDDQRYDDMAHMPIVKRELSDRGTTFTEAAVVNPWCCPSRATFLTGQYSHSHGVYTNSSPYGGFAKFDPKSTIATKLQAAGYRTALLGKYLNGYSGRIVPPGWSRWASFVTRGQRGRHVPRLHPEPGWLPHELREQRPGLLDGCPCRRRSRVHRVGTQRPAAVPALHPIRSARRADPGAAPPLDALEGASDVGAQLQRSRRF